MRDYTNWPKEIAPELVAQEAECNEQRKSAQVWLGQSLVAYELKHGQCRHCQSCGREVTLRISTAIRAGREAA